MFVKVHPPLQDQDQKQDLVKKVDSQEGNERSREENIQEEHPNIMLDMYILM